MAILALLGLAQALLSMAPSVPARVSEAAPQVPTGPVEVPSADLAEVENRMGESGIPLFDPQEDQMGLAVVIACAASAVVAVNALLSLRDARRRRRRLAIRAR